jgi:uncharacterized protein YndB with AHSA1/START domain
MSALRQVRKSVSIETTPEMAYEALTQASELREWFSDEAWTTAEPGGRYEVRWHRGYRVDGEFIDLDAPHRVSLSWWGTGEPDKTVVEFTLEQVSSGVEVIVVHRGFRTGTDWDVALAESEKGWLSGLENLKSTLETGVDLRIARQPFLGIYLDLLDAERAAKEGIAAERGIYVTGTAEGSGAEAAGLNHGDVIVSLGGVPTLDFQELGDALRSQSAGDIVDVGLVRGQERETIGIELGHRPQEDVPASAEELARLLGQRQTEANAALKEALEGLTEAEANKRPLDGEWSVKEVLAHLIISECDLHMILAAMALDGWFELGPSNLTAMPSRLDTLLALTPEPMDLLDRLLREEDEVIAFLHRLPEDTVAHKARFRRISQWALAYPTHTLQHVEQIKTIVEAARET